MRYAGIMPNDFLNGEGVSVSVWTQGCPHRCEGCHNPETWDFEGGYEKDINDIIAMVDEYLTANNINRNLSILGGEPLCSTNLEFTNMLINWCRVAHPQSKIYIWTGYNYEMLTREQRLVATQADVIIDGPFIQSKRDTTLPLRGSSNQHILYKGRDY